MFPSISPGVQPDLSRASHGIYGNAIPSVSFPSSESMSDVDTTHVVPILSPPPPVTVWKQIGKRFVWRVERDRLGSMDFLKLERRVGYMNRVRIPRKQFIAVTDLLLEISSVFFEKQLKNFESDRRGITVKSTF